MDCPSVEYRRAWRAAHPDYYRAWRLSHPTYRRDWARARRQHGDRRAFVYWLKDQPCLDCGGRFAPWVMDFDHRDPTTKKFSSARSWWTLTWKALTEEVQKCDVVCANCHRERTHRGRHWASRQ